MSVKGSGSFSKLVNDFAKEVPQIAVQVTNKAVLDLFAKVVNDTPVDTGRLRANWQLSIGQGVESEINDTDRNGGATINKAQTQIERDKTSLPVFIQNNLPYAKAIEYGGSRVKAPRGMLRKNLLLMNSFLKNAIAELKRGK